MNFSLMTTITALLAVAITFTLLTANEDEARHQHGAKEGVQKQTGDPYPLATDPVTGEELTTEPIIITHEHREFRFANSANAEHFKANPSRYLPKLDKALAKYQQSQYPLDSCIISGEDLGSMGETANYIYRNRLVRFCCSACEDGFKKHADEHIANLDEAVVTKQKPSYPLAACVVSGEKLGNHGDVVDIVVAHRLVRLCCKGCVDQFSEAPAKYLAIIDDAASDTNEGKER